MIITAFLGWFFVKAPRQIVVVGMNFLLWGWHFFSIGYFLPRIFSPWHRDITGYGRGFDFKRFLQVFAWNLISRVIGAILRIAVMVFGLLIELCIALAAAIIFIFWFILPLFSFALIIFGIVTWIT